MEIEMKQFKDTLEMIKTNLPKNDKIANALLIRAEDVLARLVIFNESKDGMTKQTKISVVSDLVQLITALETYTKTIKDAPEGLKKIQQAILKNMEFKIYGQSQEILLDTVKPITIKGKNAVILTIGVLNNIDTHEGDRQYMKPHVTRLSFLLTDKAVDNIYKDIGELNGTD